MRNIAFLLSGLLILFVLLAGTSCFSREYKGQLILVNNSNELITLARIEVCNQLIEIKNVKSNEKSNGMFTVTGDCHYDVEIYFASGKELSKQLGYVTRGFEFQHTFVITETDITINNSQVK